MLLHPKQREIVSNPARFKVIRAGRKSGKTALEVETLLFKATASVTRLNLAKSEFATGRKVIYIAPTQLQARNIVWEALKRRCADIGSAHEQLLQMRVPNEDGETSTIYVGGWENRENYRGLTDVVHVTFDEVDTLKDFFIGWQQIFRPMFLDTAGSADFAGTPKKENPNLRRLERDFEDKDDAAAFHFTSADNPHLSRDELAQIERDYAENRDAYRQEILAEYVDNAGALFQFDALVDVFTNTVDKRNDRYLIVDIADDGTDKWKFSFWEGLEEYRRETFDRLNTEEGIQKIREYAAQERIPFSNIAVDAIGVGAGVASSSFLTGVVGFKSSYAPIKTDASIVQLPNVHYRREAPLTSEYKNLRSQCIFILASLINNHKIASRVTGAARERTIEELSYYQDASKGDGKRMATSKDDVKQLLGRSPDDSDTWIMRMYFVLKDRLMPGGEVMVQAQDRQTENFARARRNQHLNSAK